LGHFTYKAVNESGGHVSGRVQSADRRTAIAELAQRGQFVVDINEGTSARASHKPEGVLGPDLSGILKFGRRRVKGKDLLAITNQLSTALRAGLGMLEALKIIRQQQHKPAVRKLLGDLIDSVSAGDSLSEAMSKYQRVFSRLYLSMVRVGETGGILEQTTGQMVKILDRDEKVKTSLKNASAYPIFVLSVGLASVIVIITWILPNIINTMDISVAALPWPTRILMGLSDFVINFGWAVVIAIVGGVWFLKRWASGVGKIKWDSFKLKIPVLGSLLRTIAVSRFARTLGALTAGGVTILEALRIVRDTLGNEFLGREMDSVTEDVKTGSPLASPLAESGYFPPLLVQIVSVGEQTGKLDELLLNAADTFEDEADSAIAKFIAVFPAVLILLLALVIGFIIAATLMPIVIMELGGGVF